MRYLKAYDLVGEDIKVPIKIGDTVLGGRFKNKKMIVKKIGKNKKGDITINDKPLLKFRLVKENLKEDIQINLSHLTDEGFIINIEESYDTDNKCDDYMIRIWLPVNKTDVEYSYENSTAFKWDNIQDEIIRTVNYLLENTEINYLYTIAANEQDGYGFKRTKWDINKVIEGSVNPGVIKSIVINPFIWNYPNSQ